MPIYEYLCPACQLGFEELVRGDQQPVCPKCGNSDLEKQLSVPASPQASASELPVCTPSPGGCGRPACGTGGCPMME
jgi:putative FmdB family regulatory protein